MPLCSRLFGLTRFYSYFYIYLRGYNDTALRHSLGVNVKRILIHIPKYHHKCVCLANVRFVTIIH